MNCIVVDDEPPALMKMKEYLSRISWINHLASFDNAIDALDFMRVNQVDLIFLDIEMEGFSGIQLVNSLKKTPLVIFTTAYENYAIKAFELGATDYLLKPFSFERFMQSLQRAWDIFHKETPQPIELNATSSDNRTFFFVKADYCMQKVFFNDILYIEGLKEYLIIMTKQTKVLTLQSFKKIEEILPPSNFVRVHKSFIVALDKIESIEKGRIKVADKFIPIGDTYSKMFFSLLENRKLY